MANVLQRIIQLVLDKESAAKAQADVENATGKMEGSWASMAKKVAGFLAAAFGTAKLIEFGKASVDEAANSQAAWSALKGTIDNTGESFDSLEQKIRDTANAFQDATIHDDDAFAGSLNRLISLTDDTEASLNNMGLVANVAAKFFKGELEPATSLVGKAMNGNINALKKLGIEADSAQEALEILAKRSMGAATAEAETFTGQLAQLTNAQGDLKKAIGESIINADGATSAFSVLQAAIKALTVWVEDNKEAISRWVTGGVKIAIDVADVFIRGVTGMANILGGAFAVAIGYATVGIAKFAEGLLHVRAGISALERFFGRDTTGYDKETKKLTAQTQAMKEWGEAAIKLGDERIRKGVATLATPLFSSEDFAGKRSLPKTPGETNAPKTGKNVKTEGGEAVEKAIKEFNESARSAANMSRILGDSFDSVGADVERTTKLLNALAAQGVDPATVGFEGLASHLREMVDVTVPLAAATKELEKNIGTGLAMSAVTAVNSLNPLSDQLELLKSQQADVLKAIESLVDAGFDPASSAVTELAERYRILGAQIKEADVQTVMHDLSETLANELFQATLDGATGLENLQIEHAALQKAIQSLIAQGINKEDEAFKRLVVRYGDVTKAMEKQTAAMQMQAAAADFLAEAMGAALQGGLAEAASKKAKQNAIEAAEMLVRAGVFALFGNFPQATASLALAAQFAAVSVAWAALGAASGGGGSAPNVPSSAGGSGGSDIASGRQSANDAASRAVDPTAEVSIYLVGPGFHAMNPEVQRVVRGAAQQAQERYGNARVRVVSSEGT